MSRKTAGTAAAKNELSHVSDGKIVRLVKGCDPKCAPTDPPDVPGGPTAMTAIYKHGVAVQYFDDAVHCRLYSESPIYK